MPSNVSSISVFSNVVGVARSLATTPSFRGVLAGTRAHTAQITNESPETQPGHSLAGDTEDSTPSSHAILLTPGFSTDTEPASLKLPNDPAAVTFLNDKNSAELSAPSYIAHINTPASRAVSATTLSLPPLSAASDPVSDTHITAPSTASSAARHASGSQAGAELAESFCEVSHIDDLSKSEESGSVGISNEPVKIRIVSPFEDDGNPLTRSKGQPSSSVTMVPGPSRSPSPQHLATSSETKNLTAERE